MRIIAIIIVSLAVVLLAANGVPIATPVAWKLCVIGVAMFAAGLLCLRSRPRRPRLTLAQLMAAIAIVGVVLAALEVVGRKVEWLESPVAVRGWSESGLHLADSRIVQLPGFAALPG